MYRTRVVPQVLALCVLLLASLAPLTASAAGQPVPQQADGSGSKPCLASNADVGYDSACGPQYELPRWSDADNWNQAQYYETIQLADFNGDGHDELLARSAAGIQIHTWDAALGQWQYKGPQVFPDGWGFSDADGWNQPQYYSTIQAAELGYNGGTAASLLVHSAGGVFAFHWDGDKSWTLLPAGPSWVWTDASNYSTIQTWKNWLIGRSPAGVETWRFENNAWQHFASSDEPFSNASGFDHPQYYETIELADLNGDGTPELVGRGVSGMQVYTWSGSEWSVISESGPFPDNPGDQPQYYRTLQYGDLDGKPGEDLVGRSPDGLVAFRWTGSGWDELTIKTPVFSDQEGWNQPQYYETIALVTLGVGQLAISGRSTSGMLTYTYDVASGDITQLTSGPALADNEPSSGLPLWSQAGYYETIQYGDVDGNGVAELIARGLFGLRTWSYDASAKTWQRPVAYGFVPFSGNDADAYNAVNNLLGPFNAPQNDPTIRGQYTTTDAPTLTTYKSSLEAQSTPPSSCTGACTDGWPAVRQQILNELDDAYWTASYYSELAALFSQIFAEGSSELTTIAQQLLAQSSSDTSIAGFFLQLFVSAFSAIGSVFGPEATVISGILAGAIGAAPGLASSGNFDGSLADADQQYTTHRQEIMDQLQNDRVYVAGDAGLMATVGQARRTTILDPTDPWVTRSVVSNGRKQTAAWSYQAIAPSLWQITGVWYFYGDCANQTPPPAGDVRYYVLNPNPNDRDCFLMVETNSVLFPELAPKEEVENILLVDNCVPSRGNSIWWEYGKCNVGMNVADFFLRQNGWNFPFNEVCQDCPRDDAPVGIEVQPYHDDKTIHLDQTGTLPVALYGTADLDVRFVDPARVTFAGAPAVGWWIPAEPSTIAVIMPPSFVQDVNGDGIVDLILQFEFQQLQLVPGANDVTMTGSMIDDTPFSASGTADVICVNNCPAD